MTGIEIGNKYNVYAADNNGEMIKNIVLFKAKEKSDCCARNFLPGGCRPYDLRVWDWDSSDLKKKEDD